LLIEVSASSALSGEQVATLIAAGRTLLSDIPQFHALLTRLDGPPAAVTP
jgi:hypothetical protein